MAVAKTIAQQITEQKKKGNFLNGLKAWIVSPGGIITIVLFVGLIWYVNHKTKEA